MPLLRLPSRPSLARLKRLAKDLLSSAQSGNPPQLQRLAALFPAVTPQSVKLAQAQTVLAREYGFASWAKLAAEVSRRAETRKAKAERATARVEDAATLAESWFAGAETGDLERLWVGMTVGKRRGQAAREVMRQDTVRYDRFVEVLMGGLSHPNARLRFEYAHLLDAFGDARCIEPLRALMDDPVPRVRWMAMHALTCHDCNEATCSNDPELLSRIAHHAHHDPSMKVRRHAAIALGEVGGPGVQAMLEGIVATTGDPALKRAAEYGLRQLAERIG